MFCEIRWYEPTPLTPLTAKPDARPRVICCCPLCQMQAKLLAALDVPSADGLPFTTAAATAIRGVVMLGVAAHCDGAAHATVGAMPIKLARMFARDILRAADAAERFATPAGVN